MGKKKNIIRAFVVGTQLYENFGFATGHKLYSNKTFNNVIVSSPVKKMRQKHHHLQHDFESRNIFSLT